MHVINPNECVAPAPIQNILAAGGAKEMATKAEVKSLRELEPEAEAFKKQLAESGHDAPKRIMAEAREANAADPTSPYGEYKGLPLGKGGLKEHFRTVRSGLKVNAKEWHAKSVAPLVVPILNRAEKVSREQHAALVAAEREAAQKFGVPFVPSNTANAVEETANRLAQEATSMSAPGLGAGSPKSVLAGIVDI